MSIFMKLCLKCSGCAKKPIKLQNSKLKMQLVCVTSQNNLLNCKNN